MMKCILENKISKRILYFLTFVAVWQLVFMCGLFSPILFPSPYSVLSRLCSEIMSGYLVIKSIYTLYLIFIGLFVAFMITALLAIFSHTNYMIKDLTKTMISILDPLPAIALLPIAILWFGIGKTAIIFIMVHSIVWPTLLSVSIGFDSVPKIYKDVGLSMGLSRARILYDIYIPAAFPNILMGIKNGWSRAWRALIAAEMVFGTTGATGGLGWDIYLKRSYLDMPGMLATLILLMVIGILVEDLFFSKIEKNTIKRWGMTI